ncbi:hypothetical protein DFP72DRAFT_861631 [Ephemerocybe angulata]|uniref:Uncharacterized protein n=1 Tax=Ephemerocybe angulata TaxID=980116 RepID=A0A8H6H901_9AGAR|nr:hypothetical protein DFP72DRAFT_861631 [Tulosesus angulatus]
MAEEASTIWPQTCMSDSQTTNPSGSVTLRGQALDLSRLVDSRRDYLPHHYYRIGGRKTKTPCAIGGGIFGEFERSVFKYISEGSLALPSSALTQELGYACTLRGTVSISAIEGREIAGYVALAKSIAIWCFAIAIFYVRYKNQSGTLISVLRRDSGVYFFSITAMRLANAIAGTFRHEPGSLTSLCPIRGLDSPMCPIPCRLLFNMQKNEDAATPSAVSTLLFEPPRWNEGSYAGPGESHGDAVEMARYAGLGRRSGV